MNKQKILYLLQEIKKELETPKKIQLEEKNLKICSDNWVKKTTNCWDEYLESPEGDCWELKNWEQLFTWERAMKEAEKLGKRLPTDEELDLLEKEDFGDVVYSGYRYTNGSFCNLGANDCFWSSSERDNSVWSRLLKSSRTTVYRHSYDKAFGFSVRLIKE